MNTEQKNGKTKSKIKPKGIQNGMKERKRIPSVERKLKQQIKSPKGHVAASHRTPGHGELGKAPGHFFTRPFFFFPFFLSFFFLKKKREIRPRENHCVGLWVCPCSERVAVGHG